MFSGSSVAEGETEIPLRVCLVASELLGWGKAGGYGFATRAIARGLAAAGHQVTVVLPCPRGKVASRFELDGFRVIAYPRGDLLRSGRTFREVGADIYHSQEPSVASFLAWRAMPHCVHLVTSRDPRDWHDWWIEFSHPTFSRLRTLLTIAVYESPLTRLLVRRADQVFVPARFLIEKAARKYSLRRRPGFLPTPIEMPGVVQKASLPVVCFVGRLDRRKRPEVFLELAASFPEVTFKVAGDSQDAEYERELYRRYGRQPNLQFLGFIDQFNDPRLSALYAESWVMINTAAREGLPNSFIEAVAHGCAIISELDPDSFTSRFGAIAHDGDYARALCELLRDSVWRERGQCGRDYVLATNSPAVAIARHLKAYRDALIRHGSTEADV
jgi:glycosyltransferase involved in cell wall biosynthesis